MTELNSLKDGKGPHPLVSLTTREREVLVYLEDFLDAHGIAPSLQEIRGHFGLASFNSVQRYLKQLQSKRYIFRPGGNLKRALVILQSGRFRNTKSNSGVVPENEIISPSIQAQQKRETLYSSLEQGSLSLPLLGKVAAGVPLERFHSEETITIPSNWVKFPSESFAVRVEGQSMIEDGICSGDILIIKQQSFAENGQTVIASIFDHSSSFSTVKRFYLHDLNKKNDVIHSSPQSYTHSIELRPANSNMKSLWFSPDSVQIQGLVVGLYRDWQNLQ